MREYFLLIQLFLVSSNIQAQATFEKNKSYNTASYNMKNMCPPDYLSGGNGSLAGVINNTEIYETDGEIESTQTIESTAVVEYDSKVKITLNAGFNTVNGSTFFAYIDGCNMQCNSFEYDSLPLAVNSAFISDFGVDNNFSDNHYEYYLVISDGIYNGGNEYIGGTYSLTIELLSFGNTFTYGEFPSCFFCGSETNYSYVGHLFLIEDTNNDDLLDFNRDPTYDGDAGFVKITNNNNFIGLEIDFEIGNGKTLKGCHTDQFTITPFP